MQLTFNHINIPEELIQAHEDGRVVFFCGAGISFPAGLPGFQELVAKTYQELGSCYDEHLPEKIAFEREEYDRVFALLEQRYPTQNNRVRRAVEKLLTPDDKHLTEGSDVLKTHQALLTLSKKADNEQHLVTTNFDRLFEVAAKQMGSSHTLYTAPTLPVPKNKRWDGLVYLHGVLPEVKGNEFALLQCVLSSGDFGRAYLVERWASRFVSELCRNYVVCFVGYSLGDSVLRYLMDALAADRQNDEKMPKVYAFAPYKTSESETDKKAVVAEWKSKNVEPIPYEVKIDIQGKTTKKQGHSLLHFALQNWAARYASGITGRQSVIASEARLLPDTITPDGGSLKDVLWALNDESGLAAQQFTILTPVPPLAWLDEIVQADLPPIRKEHLVGFFTSNFPWSNTASALAEWLLRHLNNPDLLIWLSQRGGQLHENFKHIIARHIEKLEDLQRSEKETDKQKLIAMSEASPNAIPSTKMKTLWQLMLAGRVGKPQNSLLELHRLRRRIESSGLTLTNKFALRNLLEPKLALYKEYPVATQGRENSDPANLLRYELVFSSPDLYGTFKDANNPKWQQSLPELLANFESILKDALDIMAELGQAGEKSDLSYIKLPSISEHEQNRYVEGWPTLIVLLRDAWLETKSQCVAKAGEVAKRWFDYPYPAFKRLALFAASQLDLPPSVWVHWLTSGSHPVLWLVSTKREVMRLLVLQGPQLDQRSQQKLETAILQGPPRILYESTVETERWQQLKSQAIGLRLAKLNLVTLLGSNAQQSLDAFKQQYPNWIVTLEQDKDEFSFWSSVSGFEDAPTTKAPRERRKLAEWLMQEPADDFFYKDDWEDICREQMSVAFTALCQLSQDSNWPSKRWEQALYVWGDPDLAQRAWRYAAGLVAEMPKAEFSDIEHAISWWLEKAAGKSSLHDAAHNTICVRIIERYENLPAPVDRFDASKEDVIAAAINHPIGQVTEAIITKWFLAKPQEDSKLPEAVSSLLRRICATTNSYYFYAKAVLARDLITLFRIDSGWVGEHLLPSFSWQQAPDEAAGMWSAFMIAPRRYEPLLKTIKQDFLETSKHYASLGMSAEQYAYFITYCALEGVEGFKDTDFQTAFYNLPEEGLAVSIRAVTDALEASDDKYPVYWSMHVKPFWNTIWPKDKKLATPKLAQEMAKLCIAAKELFPNALDMLEGWLKPLEYPYYVVRLLADSGLCEQFPSQALKFLDAVIGGSFIDLSQLEKCLNRIKESSSSLAEDKGYKRLGQLVLV